MGNTVLPMIPSGTLRQTYFDLSINGTKIPTYNYFQSFSYERKTSAAGNTGSITLFDPNWSYLESFVLLKDQPNADIEFSYGWSDLYSKPIKGKITAYSPEFSSDGVTLKLDFMGLEALNSCVRDNLSFKVGTRISDIVKQYADSRGIKETVIEKTRGGFDSPIIKRNCNDDYFIQNELVPRAVNLKGLSGYLFFYDETGVLHFHTPLYSSKNADTIKVYKTYLVYRGMNGEVISFTPDDMAYKRAFLGSHKVFVESVDPKTKKVIKSVIDSSGSSTQIISGKLSDAPKIKGKSASRTIKSAHPKQESIDDQAKSRFACYNLDAFSATAEILGDPYLPIAGQEQEKGQGLAFVEFIVITSQDRVHPLSGIYWIKHVTDSMDGGSYTSSLELSRSSSNVPRAAALYDLETKNKIGNILREVRESNLVTKDVEK